MRMNMLSLLALLACAPALPAQDAPALPDIDRVRIAEAFRLADAVQDKIWPAWSTAPFAVLLVTPKYEFLMRHPNPSSDFTLLGYDSVLKEKVWYRERQYSISFLATFPAVSGLPTIVIGEAEYTTSKTSTPWVVTLLHDSRPSGAGAESVVVCHDAPASVLTLRTGCRELDCPEARHVVDVGQLTELYVNDAIGAGCRNVCAPFVIAPAVKVLPALGVGAAG